jgi:TolB-like protein
MSTASPGQWHQIEALFAAALDTPAGERTALLDRACADDPALRTSLDRLLRAHERAGRFLEGLDGTRAAALLEGSAADSREEQIVGKYRVVRRLGRGGMGVVYLAHDERLDRPVALKLLPPYLSADELAARRLVEEAKAASALDHPHIITIYEIGETADDRLFLAMAFYEGETLRERIARGPLPVAEAVGLAAQVAEGLAAAHRKGIVHRDVKPENLLITTDGMVKILDFGLAKVGGQVLTRPGATPGTVAYMSPEQTRGEAVDPRTDLWSLGVVLYEMLAGVRPFRGDAEAAVIHGIRHDAPEPVDALRPGIPAALATTIRTCLEKNPKDRCSRADDLLAELRTVLRPEARPRRRRVFHRHSRRVAAVAVAALVLGVLGVAAHIAQRRTSGPVFDPAVVAVLPFRVGGADPAIGYLREGMVDLMAAMFVGDRGLRAVDPRSLLSAWRRSVGDETRDLTPAAGRRLAANLGAGRLLLGEVASAPGQLALNVSLLDVGTGNLVASAAASGPPDSLLVLLERLAVQLEARQAGESEDRLPRLTSTSIAAVRAYLTGRTAYRQGEYQRAHVELERAIALDSTFAIAALALLGSYVWASGDAPVARAAALAWSLHHRLSARDRALLEGLVGPAPVEPTGPATWFTGHLLEARRRAALAAPDTPEAWLMLGDAFFHWGRFHAIEAWEERAEAALQRALELDSAFAAPLVHLVEIAAMRGDTSEVRARRNLYLARHSTGEQAEFVRWRSAVALGDTPVMITSQPAQLERLPIESLDRMVTAVRTDAVGLDDAPHIARALATRLSRTGEGVVYAGPAWGPLIAYTLDRGRPRDAVAFVERQPPQQIARAHVLNALYWDGDPSAAARAAQDLARQARQELSNRDPSARGLNGLCIWEQWRLAHGDASTASRAIARLNASAYPGDQLCALILGALLALATDSATQAAAAEELESFLLGTGVLGGPTYEYANLVLARVHEASGDVHAALAALRRRGGRHPWGLYLSTYLQEEGRLAAQLGDRDGAIRAYHHYLALRSAPEPALQSRAAQVREEFARLDQGHR